MTAPESPAPSPADAAAADGADAADSVAPDSPDRRPRATVSTGAVWLVGLAAAGCALFVCCVGGMAAVALASARAGLSDARARRDELLRVHAEDEEVEFVLDSVAERLLATHYASREFPRVLPEAPPLDPWGTPLRYERGAAALAWLRSAGRDREFDTADDVVRRLEPR